MKGSVHTIQKTVVEVNYSGHARGLDVQKKVEACISQLMPEIERILNEYDEKELVLSIDAVNLNILLEGENWQKEWVNQFRIALTEKFASLHSGNLSGHGISTLTPGTHVQSTLLYYLKNGYLPWNVAGKSQEEWRIRVKKLFGSDVQPVFIRDLLELIRENDASRIRLIREIPFDSFLEFLKTNESHLIPTVRSLTKDVTLLMTIIRRYSSGIYENDRVATLLMGVLSGDAYAEEQCLELLAEKLTALPSAPLRKNITRNKQLVTSVLGETFHSGFMILMQQLVKEIWTDKKGWLSKTAKQGTPSQFQEVEAEVFQKAKNTIRRDEFEKEQQEGIYISNAGLIILAPFLPMLFKNTGLWNGEVLTQTDKAVCMTGFLAKGNTFIHESELVLPKILCGLEPDSPVDMELFTADERVFQETGQLIESAIEYWDVLKNTSVEGLRESFILRDGKLVRKDKEWILRVEQRSYDLLLQQLPWNISMIRLPWMQAMVYTEWIF